MSTLPGMPLDDDLWKLKAEDDEEEEYEVEDDDFEESK